MAIPGTAAFDLGAGVGVEAFSQGGTAILKLTVGSSQGTPGTAGVAVKLTGPNNSNTGPAVLAKVVNGITAQTNTITFYDATSSATCTPANAVYTIATAAANAIFPIDIPIINGLWYAASGVFTGPINVYFD
jgi:hypothetical protein